jgi:hypothetical protein
MPASNQLFDNPTRGADFSPCRKYRYSLWRIWDESLPAVMFIGLNPSKADESENDNTIRRVVGMAKEWGYGGVYMLNCFPFISTNPDDLKDFGNSEENDHHIRYYAQICEEIIFAWGAFEIVKASGRGEELKKMFPNAKALIINRDGSPRHPLYVPKSVTPIKFR